MWQGIDFTRSITTLRRVQERDGSTTDQTKTDAGQREIPISPTLRKMLLELRLLCTRLDSRLYRVFAGPGREQPWPLPRKGAGVRYVTHHSARRSFVCTLQAQGVEVGLVAKHAGHANPSVTLGHNTQAVRGGAETLAALDALYISTAS